MTRESLREMSASGSPRQRRGYVLETVAAILAEAAAQGCRFVLTIDGSGSAAEFADDLAETLRRSGGAYTRLSDKSSDKCSDKSSDKSSDNSDGTAVGLGVVLADGAGWRDRAPDGRWDVIIFLRTATPRGNGNGEHGADIVIDHHDPGWPVIRHVSPRLQPPTDRLYVTETQAFFGARAFTWNEKFGDDLPAYRDAVIEADVPRGATMVDVGCGTGRALPALRDAAGGQGTVIGIDVTPEMLTVAASQCDGDHSLVMADARHLPLATASVDVIFAAGLIQHLPDPGAGLAELARIVRTGGKMIIFHPSGRAVLAARHGKTLRADEPLNHPHLQRLLTANGWELTRYDDPPERFYALAQRV